MWHTFRRYSLISCQMTAFLWIPLYHTFYCSRALLLSCCRSLCPNLRYLRAYKSVQNYFREIWPRQNSVSALYRQKRLVFWAISEEVLRSLSQE